MRRFFSFFVVLVTVIFLLPFPLSGQEIRWHGGSWEAAKVLFGLRQSISCATGLPDCLSWRRNQRQPTKTQRVLRTVGATATQGYLPMLMRDNPQGFLPVSARDRRQDYAAAEVKSLAQSPPEATFRLGNSLEFLVEAYDGDKYLGAMAPGAWWTVGPPEVGYQGWAMKPADGGKVVPTFVPLKGTNTGWVFVSQFK